MVDRDLQQVDLAISESAVKVFGIDFTSQPSRRKPFTCAVCEVNDNLLTFDRLERWRSFDELEAFLASAGPWIAGLDFPFGQADRFVDTIGWPHAWKDYVAHAASFDRKDFRTALDAYRAGRDAGDKEHRRRFDVLAGAISPQKLYGVPVGLMFYEGAGRLAASDVTIPGLMAGDPSKIVLEAYPGIAARNLVGRASYKNDQATKQTADHLQTRLRILRTLQGEAGQDLYGLRIQAPVDICEDPGGDDLDALLCAVQAAWGWRNLATCLEAVGASEEGWIADPALFRDAKGIELRIDPFPSVEELKTLWQEAWNGRDAQDYSAVLSRSLTHVGAYRDNRLVGFVNVAWDGGIHAFILDTCVHPRMRRQGIATRLVQEATRVARGRGARWLHVDFEPHLRSLYLACGFRSTEAGVMKLG